MAVRTQTAKVNQGLSLAQRRAYLKLPLAERRRRLAEQAERMVEHYAQEPERIERETWQGGDIVEPQGFRSVAKGNPACQF